MKIGSFIILLIFFRFAQAETSPSLISKVAKSKTWLRLLHYDSKNGQSDIVDPQFFFSALGSTHPELELAANIQRIADEPLDTQEEHRFSCRFPARQRFIE